MSRARHIALIAIPVILLLLVPLAVYGIDQAVASGKVGRNVSVAGVELGGATPEEAAALIEVYERELQTSPATFVVDGTEFELDPLSVALNADIEAAVDNALGQRSHAFFAGFLSWVASFGNHIELQLAWSVDPDAVTAQLVEWEGQAIKTPAYEGSVQIVDGEVTYQYPAAGLAVDRSVAPTLIASLLATPNRDAVELALATAEPTLTAADIDVAVATVEHMLSRPAVLTDVSRGVRFVLDRDQLAGAIRVDIVKNSDAMIEVSLSEEVVRKHLAARRAELEVAPVNAGFDIDIETDAVSIIPSRIGRTVDPTAATVSLLAAATSGFSQPLPYMAGTDPEYSTEDAEAFGPLGLVSEFTTNMPGVNRVHNIKLMADTIDGHVVWPDEEFSINDFVGERTEEGGYLRDGAIIKGEVTCCDEPANVGGGVSQYGTTIYNAIFFGCYEDLDHTPHSLHISRYPEGREATLGFPAPDVRFGNDTEVPVIIRNTYTDNTITVKFYGNNGGRECTAERSERFNPTSPRLVYEANAAVTPGTENVVSKGSGGFSVTVTRVMTMPDGRVIRQPYTHRYRGAVRRIEKHPCNMSSSIECPVKVPGVVGLDLASASAALDGAGFLFAINYVTDAENVDRVISASPGGWQPPGTTITLTVGQSP
jgi:vancomycin resistance protein YoaR